MYNLGQYIPRESPVHKRDPRTKIIAVIAFSILIMQMNTIWLLGVCGLIIACSKLARIPLQLLLSTLRPVLPFLFFLFLIYMFATPGRPLPLLSHSLVHITYDGLYLGLEQIGRFLLLVLTASILTMTTSPSEITTGLERLLRPLKVIGISSHNVAMMVSLALRFVPTLLDQMNHIREAQLARGANFNTLRPSQKIKALSYLAISLSINTLSSCNELVDAMESRGYHQGDRTYLTELSFTRSDYGIFIAITLTILLMIF